MKHHTRLLLVLPVAALLAVAAVAGSAAQGKLFGTGVHADVSVVKRDGSTAQFEVDRGRITAVSGSSLTLARRDGRSLTFTLNSTTRSRGEPKVGARAFVVSRGGTALVVRVARTRQDRAAGRQRGERGAGPLHGTVHAEVTATLRNGTTRSFAYDRGKISAQSSSSITLTRADGVSVSFTRDASTKVRGEVAVGARAIVVSQAGKAVRIRAARAKAGS